MKRSRSFLFPLFACSLLTCFSCGGETPGVDLYSNVAQYLENDLSVSYEYSIKASSSTYSVSMHLELLSTNPKPISYQISNAKVIRGSNGAEYSVAGVPPTKFDLECDIKRSLNFGTSIPTDPRFEKYTLSFNGNGKTYNFHFYNSAVEQREKAKIHFMIDGSEMGTTEILNGGTFSSQEWISSDYIYYCYRWYTAADKQTPVSAEAEIYNDFFAYGSKNTILYYEDISLPSKCNVTRYNYIPQTGEIVVPKMFEGRSVYSVPSGAFSSWCSGLTDIYFPKTLSSIRGGTNFLIANDLKRVHFEGTEAEWSEINYCDFKSGVEIIFNSYK